jgi:copper transport outer membrane protein MctB
MIDFRYHLVSLVSVFLALAVGIVLGAGPLKESIGTQLNVQVDRLRSEKDGLRAEVDTQKAALDHRDAFVDAVAPTLVSGQLAGRSVSVITLPGVNDDLVDPLVDAITTAGGTVSSRLSIGGAWVDPDREPDRTKVLNDLVTRLPAGTVPATGETGPRLARLLAGALVTTSSTGQGNTTQAGTAVLDALDASDLIGVKGKVAGLAGSALVLAPGNPEADTKLATPAGQAQTQYIDIAEALHTVGGGAVVTGPASSATGDGLLSAIRGDDTAKKQISTVDTGSTPMGVVSAVLALREQLSGGVGSYGFGSGVKAPLPALSGVTG